MKTDVAIPRRHSYVDGVCTVCNIELLYGDVNNDRKLNAFDISKLLSYIEGSVDIREFFDIDSADMDTDGKINSLDIVAFKTLISGN